MSLLKQLLQRATERGASDIHIKTDSNPYFRIDGELVPRKRMLGKGEIETHLVQQRTDLQRRTQYLAHVLQSQVGQRVVFERPQGGQMLWVSFRQPLAWDDIVAALAGSALHALPGEQFGLPGHYPQHLALIWLRGDPDELQLAVRRLAQALEVRCGRSTRFSS